MDRLALWMRWSWRDLRARIVQVAAVAAIVALGTGVYAGLSTTSAWRQASYDASYIALDSHDVLVTLAQNTTVGSARLHDAIASVPGVADVETRLIAPVQVDASQPGKTILVPGRLVGFDPSNKGPHIDRLDVQRGRALTGTDARKNVVALDTHFAEYHDLPPTGTLTLSGGTPVNYVSHVLSPEYFMVMGTEGTFHAEANYAVMFAPIKTVQRITGQPGRVNDAVVRLDPGIDRRAGAAAIDAALQKHLPDVAATTTALDDERGYRLMYDDIKGDQRLFTIFAFLVLGGAAFAAFNLVGRIVESQRREIGIGMSLGTPPWQIAIRPALVGFQVALLGAVFGIFVGLGLARVVLGVIEGFVPLPVWRTPFGFGPYARAWTIGLVVPFVATLIPVIRAIRVAPIDAIRTGPTAAPRTGLAPLLARLTTGNSLRQMPARNVLRAPRRTALTALAIAAAIATLVGVIGIVDSFAKTIDEGEAAVLGDTPDRLTVGLASFALDGGKELTAISATRGVAAAEPGLQLGGTLRNGSHEIESMLRLLPLTGDQWRPTVSEGTLPTSGTGIVIAEKAARDLHANVGDEIVLNHPRRKGMGYEMVDSKVRIAAIHEIPYRFVSFMDSSAASLMDLEGIYNTVGVTPEAGADSEQVQRKLFAIDGVASVQPVRSFAETIRDLMAQMLGILRVIEGAVLLLALLIAFNSSAISVDERARENATMFAFGVPVGRVLANIVIESIAVGVLGTAIGIGLGRAIVGYITTFLLPNTLPDVLIQPAVSTGTIVTAIVLGVIAVSVAPLFTERRMRRMNIPATLRVVE